MVFASPVLTYAEPFAYITNYYDDTVQVIDLSNNQIVTGGDLPIDVGSAPIGITMNPAAKIAYVTNYGDGLSASTVSVIDTSSNEVIGSPINVGIGPIGIAVNPAGTFIYVANQGSSTVSVINTSTGLPVLGTPIALPAGSAPNGIAIDPSGAFVYVTNEGTDLLPDSTVSVINTSTNTVSSTIPVGSRPFGITINPAGTRAYVTNSVDGTVSVINTSSKSVIDTITLYDTSANPHGIAVSPDGNKVYVANYIDHTVSVIDVQNDNDVEIISSVAPITPIDVGVGAGPYGIDVKPDGTEVYVANSITGTVSAINTTTYLTVLIPSVGAGPRGFGKFVQIPTYTITTSVPGGNGTIGCTTPVNYGGSSTCTITPATGYHLATLTDNTVNVIGSVSGSTYTITNVTAAHAVAGTFAINTYAITTSVPGGNGTIVCTTPVNYGSSSTCTITPATGYSLATLTDNTVNVIGSVSGSTYTITNVTAAHAVAGTFAINTYAITTSVPGGNGTIVCTTPVNYGGSSTCTITPATGYSLATLTDNTVNVIGSVSGSTYTITNVTAAHAVAGTFAISTFTITTSVPGGNGTIGCTTPVNYGGSSTCTITPATGYHLATLTDNTVNVIGSVSGSTYTITNVTAAHAVAGTFAINTYAITTSVPGGNGTIVCTTPVNYGGSSTCTITPATGYSLATLTDNTVNVIGSVSGSTYTITNVTAAHAVAGTFAINTYAITTSVPGGNGTIVCTTPVNYGGSSTCTITPATGYSLATLTDNTVNVIGSVSGSTYTITNVTAAHAVAGTFAINTYAITTSVPGGNGTIVCTTPVNYGGSSTCTITPATGYSLATLTDNTVNVIGSVSGSTYTITNVTAAHAVAGTFAINTYAITTSITGGNGTLTCTTPVNYGGSSTCTITPATGYHLATLTDNTVNVIGSVSGSTYTITNVTAAHAVAGTFAINTYAITTSVPGGNGTIVCTTPVNYGSSSTCTITPATNYYLATLTDNTVNVIGSVSGSTYTITNVTAAHAVAGAFARYASQIGVFRNGTWYLDYPGTGTWVGCGTTSSTDRCYAFGLTTDMPVVGDWSASGKTKIGIFRNGNWYLDYPGTATWVGCGAPADPTKDGCIAFGIASDILVVGDWNGDGHSKIGVFRNGMWYLDYSGTYAATGTWAGCGAPADPTKAACIAWGVAGDIPVVGDWSGNGKSSIGVFRNGTWYLDYPGTGTWVGCGTTSSTDRCYAFGLPTDIPVVGDWNASGSTKIGIFRSGNWYLDYSGTYAATGIWAGCGAPADPTKAACKAWGIAGDIPVVGNWNGL